MVLYLIPCNLAEDTVNAVLSPQINEVVKNTKYYFAENIKTARRFISSLRLGLEIEKLIFYEVSKKTPMADVINYYKEIGDNDIGMISEAGCPGVADPGSVPVKYAHQNNIKVVPLVGPSSILLALMASGFNGQQFVFHGYFPIERPARCKMIRQVELDAKAKNQTQIFMETPFRNNHLFEDILANCNDNTLVCVASNVTSSSEFIKTQMVKDWKKNVPDLHKIPTIFLIYSYNL
jgi:16S rRNA (cytidine1402-2'-O)-methyltransferase